MGYRPLEVCFYCSSQDGMSFPGLPLTVDKTTAQGLSVTGIAASWFHGTMSPPACSLDGCWEPGVLFGMEDSNLLGIAAPFSNSLIFSRRFS